MKKKNFENWTYEEVEVTFGIIKVSNSTVLNKWLSASHFPDSVRTVLLDEIHKDIIKYRNSYIWVKIWCVSLHQAKA